MANHQGLFIVLEGADGSGKSTQFAKLQDRLKAAGYDVAVFDFPRYDNPSSYFVRRYLTGEYGPASSINPYTASLFYALDRFEAAAEIKKALADGKIVLSDRYVGSNMAHQGSKFKEAIEKRSFFVWEDSIEYQLLNIPRPHLNIFLRVPAEVSYELMSQRNQRSYTEKVRDEHEADIDHLRESVATYDLLCQLFPKDFVALDCAPHDKLLSIDAIGDMIWELLTPLLPPASPPPAVKKPATVAQANTPEPLEVIWQIDQISLLALDELRLKQVDVSAAPVWRSRNHHPHITPALAEADKQAFNTELDQLAKLYRTIFNKLTKHLGSSSQARPWLKTILPLAASTTAQVTVTKATAVELLAKLRNSGLREVAQLANQLAKLIIKTWPELSADELAASSAKPESVGQIIEKLSQGLLPQQLGDVTETARLIEAVPKNEFELLVDSLYPYSSMARPQIQAEIERWEYAKKSEALTLALANPGALALARYRFDLMTSRHALSAVAEHKLASQIQLQPMSPRFGYEVPAIIEAAGADNEYIDMFDRSLALYSQLQAQKPAAAEYAALAGHRLRWQGSFSARQIQIMQASDTPVLAELAKFLQEGVLEAHPLVASSLQGKPTPAAPAKRPRSRGRKPKKS